MQQRVKYFFFFFSIFSLSNFHDSSVVVTACTCVNAYKREALSAKVLDGQQQTGSSLHYVGC